MQDSWNGSNILSLLRTYFGQNSNEPQTASNNQSVTSGNLEIQSSEITATPFVRLLTKVDYLISFSFQHCNSEQIKLCFIFRSFVICKWGDRHEVISLLLYPLTNLSPVILEIFHLWVKGFNNSNILWVSRTLSVEQSGIHFTEFAQCDIGRK